MNEGDSFIVTVSTTYVDTGTILYYSFSGTGITAGDLSGNQLTGDGTIDSGGNFTITDTIAEDVTTEGS